MTTIHDRIRRRRAFRDLYPIENPNPTPDPVDALTQEVRQLRGAVQVEALRTRSSGYAARGHQTRDGGTPERELIAMAERMGDSPAQAREWASRYGR